MPEKFTRRAVLISPLVLGVSTLAAKEVSAAKPKPWKYRSVDMMKATQDTMRNPADEKQIDDALEKVVDLNATHVAIGTAYDSGNDQFDQNSQTKTWIDAIKARKLHTWHRHVHTAFQEDKPGTGIGFYEVPVAHLDFAQIIHDYILQHRDFFQEGDIFAPFPEPQNGGILGVNRDESGTYQFDSAADFNKALRSYIDVSHEAFSKLGFAEKDIHVGFYGLDGFTIDGLGNPDWEGKGFLEDETVKRMGKIVTADHYPSKGGKVEEDYHTMEDRFPQAKFVVGEFGPIGHDDPSIPQEIVLANFDYDLQTLREDKRVIGLNYWPFLGGKKGENAIEYDEVTGSFIETPVFPLIKEAFS